MDNVAGKLNLRFVFMGQFMILPVWLPWHEMINNIATGSPRMGHQSILGYPKKSRSVSSGSSSIVPRRLFLGGGGYFESQLQLLL